MNGLTKMMEMRFQNQEEKDFLAELRKNPITETELREMMKSGGANTKHFFGLVTKLRKEGLIVPDVQQSFEEFKKSIIDDFKLAYKSRQASLLGRKEVLSGKGSFGIFGDGKELAQIGMAKVFKNGDFRSGYYRDQTLLMAQGHLSVSNIFSALYADLNIENEPMSGGRSMGGHFVSACRNEKGDWLNVMEMKNHSGDVSPTGSQMPRLLGLAQASKVYRNYKTKNRDKFSNNGNEIAWGTIGNASTSEGMFFETINAAGVLQVPMIISVWDDGYGISVSNKDQTTKQS